MQETQNKTKKLPYHTFCIYVLTREFAYHVVVRTKENWFKMCFDYVVPSYLPLACKLPVLTRLGCQIIIILHIPLCKLKQKLGAHNSFEQRSRIQSSLPLTCLHLTDILSDHLRFTFNLSDFTHQIIQTESAEVRIFCSSGRSCLHMRFVYWVISMLGWYFLDDCICLDGWQSFVTLADVFVFHNCLSLFTWITKEIPSSFWVPVARSLSVN